MKFHPLILTKGWGRYLASSDKRCWHLGGSFTTVKYPEPPFTENTFFGSGQQERFACSFYAENVAEFQSPWSWQCWRERTPMWLWFSSTANSLISTHWGALGVIAINTRAANKPCFTSIILWYYQLRFTPPSVSALSGNELLGNRHCCKQKSLPNGGSKLSVRI